MPQYAARKPSAWRFYYLMVDQNGAAQLTSPVVKGGTFIAAIERIYLSRGAGDDGIKISDDIADVAIEFEPQIARK